MKKHIIPTTTTETQTEPAQQPIAQAVPPAPPQPEQEEDHVPGDVRKFFNGVHESLTELVPAIKETIEDAKPALRGAEKEISRFFGRRK